jgi:hypothetical protein
MKEGLKLKTNGAEDNVEEKVGDKTRNKPHTTSSGTGRQAGARGQVEIE